MKMQNEVIQGTPPAPKPTVIPTVNITGKPAQPPLYTQPNQQPAKQKTVAPAPDLQKQLQDAFGPNYVPPAKQAQVGQPTSFERTTPPEFDSEQVKPLLDLDEFGNPKQEGIPAPPAATREPTSFEATTPRDPAPVEAFSPLPVEAFSPLVKMVQQKLMGMGYPLTFGADGKLGQFTRGVLEQFKQEFPQFKDLSGKALYSVILATHLKRPTQAFAIDDLIEKYGKKKAKKKKLDPKAKVRNRGTVVFPAERTKDKKKDRFPINDIDQARNALSRVMQYDKAPEWYGGSLKSLQEAVRRKVHSKYPSIEISDGKKKKSSNDFLSALINKYGSLDEE